MLFYFWLHWVFVAACRLSLVAARGAPLCLWSSGLSLQRLLLLWSTGFRYTGFGSCCTWAQWPQFPGSRAQAQDLWHTGWAALEHMESSRTRDWTHVPCIGRRIPSYWTTREVLNSNFIFNIAEVLIYIISDAIIDCMLLNFVHSLLLTLEQPRVGTQTLML